MKTVEGTITKVYASNSGPWASIVVETKEGKMLKAAGAISNPIEGYRISMTGTVEEHPKYGPQFKVNSCKLTQSDSLNGIIAYLSSGFIKGVGEKIAERIVGQFGFNTIDIIKADPKKLTEVPGITMQKAMIISQMHAENESYLKLVDYFGGLATDYEVRTIYEKYGPRSLDVLRENPYTVIYDIKGFGFKKADKLAKAAGLTADDPRRIAAAVTYVLRKLSDDGHCYCHLDALEGILQDLIKKESTNPVPLELISDIIVAEVEKKNLYLDGEKLYLKSLYDCEEKCAFVIDKMLRSEPVKKIPDRKIKWALSEVEDECGFELEKRQCDAISAPLRNRISVVTGGPGTGKTTIIRGMIKAWDEDDRVFLVAPTGKASRRMSEVTDGTKAETIHRFIIEYKTLIKEERNTIKDCLFIVDEASMIDIELGADILRIADETNSSIVFIGDIDQLASIGPGNFFRDLVQSPCVPSIRLELSYRQSGMIAINADRINNGVGYAGYTCDGSFNFIKVGADDVLQTVMEEYMKLVKEYGITEVCCLVPTRQGNETKTCSNTLNKLIREKLNPWRPGTEKIGWFRIGDRVMYTKNNYKKEVFNGECGIIKGKINDEFTVEFDDGRLVDFVIAEASSFVLAYAMTVHKSQGSEYKAVVLAQAMEHYIMLQRNLLYTGVTRAKEKVIIVGEGCAMNIAVKTVKTIIRNTQLKDKIAKRVSQM